jgi:hypothetical protein
MCRTHRRVKRSVVIVACVAVLLVPVGAGAAASPQAASAPHAHSFVIPPELLAEAMAAFAKSLRDQGVMRLARTAARDLRAGQQLRVRTFTDELASLYESGETYNRAINRAIVSAICASITADNRNPVGQQQRSPEVWVNALYLSVRPSFPHGPFWDVIARSRVETIVRTTRIAYGYSPAMARAYLIACGRKR